MAEDKYNLKNPAVKRILQEVKEMQSNPSDDFMSLPLEENIFEWQFAIRGPSDSEFEGGIYHGRIQLPAEYPFKPPSFMLLTPNGRFETQTKICLSISNHHPEHWQPSWSVRTALVALIAFMPTSPNGALGSLDYKKEERHVLAIKSREAAPRFGTPERQKLIDEIHEYMLSKAPLVPQLNPSQASEEHSTDKEDEANQSSEDAAGAVTPGEGLTNPAVVRTALVALIAFMPTSPNGALGSLDYKKEERHVLAIKSREAAPRFGTPERQKLIDEIHENMLSKAPLVPQLNPSQASEEHSTDKEDEANQSSEDAAGAVTPGEGLTNPAVGDRIVEEPHEASLNGNPRPEGMGVSRQVRAGPTSEQLLQRSGPRVQKPADDRLFTWAAVGLTIAIVVLLLKKFMKASEHGAVFMDGS
ncbi:hypothetical protein TEA_012814 [Camellia sinensis var. sinensis]|uniref:UBC core domain-containing protein n=1 Tax=Camellia sinensis var. sinensis TaxID=542762 RepID=A0A4S4D2L6_CAMSN|nr:hypothetical protein TEA_012814 [Camellia sinensis var. sinensis]